MDELQDWEYVKRGITLWLNNMPKAAEDSFKDRPSSVHIVAGHTFISFMVSKWSVLTLLCLVKAQHSVSSAAKQLAY